jgi:membrane-bound lytic murein transglycosylase D
MGFAKLPLAKILKSFTIFAVSTLSGYCMFFQTTKSLTKCTRMMNRLLCTFFFSFLFFFNSFAQEEADKTIVQAISAEDPDSMDLQIGIQLPLIDSAIMADTSLLAHCIYVPDSVYIKRLHDLSYTFKMDYNPVVQRYIELYTWKIKDKLEVMIGLSSFYFPIIENILDSYHLPKELEYISIIESALNPRIVSRARAVGLWQFIKSTGKECGLTINNYVDQRRACTESTKAAAIFLKRLYSTYGDWQLVLAAYNCGPGNVNKAIRRSGGKRDFWEIYKYLPRETRGYIPCFIGAAYALNYYKEHNLVPVPHTLPLQTDTLLINRSLHLEQVATILNIPLETLRILNPEYIKDIIPANSKKLYSLKVPSEQKPKFIGLQDSIYAYNASFYFKTEPKIEAFSDYRSRNRSHTPEKSDQSGKVIHRVNSGESIWLIARQYNVSVNSIKDWNNISGKKIRAGQKLIIYVPKKGNTGKKLV